MKLKDYVTLATIFYMHFYLLFLVKMEGEVRGDCWKLPSVATIRVGECLNLARLIILIYVLQ
jgi:hypothetical protein